MNVRMTVYPVVAVVVALMSPMGARPGLAQQADATRWVAAVTAIDRAALRGDSVELQRGLDEVVAIRQERPEAEARALALYAAAYARWRLAVLPDVNEQRKEAALDTALDELDEAVKLLPTFADAYSLRAGVLGLQIGTSLWRGMTIGPRIGAAGDKAKALAPNNPRVLLGEGVGAFNTPSAFGGGMNKAEQLLRQALTAFDREPRDKPWPNWGRFDAHAWLGQVLVNRRDFAGARQHYDRAREEAPESGWLRYVLIPALEKAEKKAK